MAVIPSLPVTLQNGTTADATQVMANFNAIVSAVNSNAANSGINTNITQLAGLTIAVAVNQGGTGQFVLTPNAVLLGEGTNGVNGASPGAIGTVLTSNGPGADPSFQSLALGTMASQNASAVAITGGTIAGTAISGGTITGAAHDTTNTFVTQSPHNNSVAAATTAYVDAACHFGSWASQSINTTYQAATDGFVVVNASLDGSGANGSVNGITDSNSTPSTVRTSASTNITNYNWNMGLTMPVRKGDYWKITTTGSVTGVTVYWLPLGN